MRSISLFLLAFAVISTMADMASADRTTGAMGSAAASEYKAVMPDDLYDGSLPKTSQVLNDAGFETGATVEDYSNGLKDLKPIIAFVYADELPQGNLPLAMAFKEVIASQPDGAYDRISLLAIENTAENSSKMGAFGCYAIPCLAYQVIVEGEVYHRVNIGGPGSQKELDRMVDEWREMMDYMSDN